jgi:hypothetical protein
MGATYNPLGLAGFTAAAGTYEYDPLLTDGDDVVTRKAKFAAAVATPLGPVVKRGTICQYAPATGLLTAGDGAEPVILAEDCDTTLATAGTPVEAIAYASGKFNAAAIIWDPAQTNHAITSSNCRHVGILIESTEWRDGSTVKSVPTAEETKNAQAIIERNRAAKKEAQEEAAKPNKEATDAPYAYLTPEEREKNIELAHLHPGEDLSKELGFKDEKDNNKGQHPAPTGNLPHAQHLQTGHKPGEKK